MPTPAEPLRRIYMNNAANGWPLAPGVAEAMAAAAQRMPDARTGVAVDAAGDAEACRASLACLLGVADRSRIALTAGATHALNAVWWGLGLKPGAHVVTTVSEHNSMLRPLHHLGQRVEGLRVTPVGLGSDGTVDMGELRAALRDGADVVALNHASNVTGLVADAREVFQAAKAAGAVTVLDACQSLGHVPVLAGELLADIVVATGHKLLHGPTGVGVLYVSQGLELEPWLVGGTGARSDLVAHPPEMPTRLEAGTPNAVALAGLRAALDWQAVRGGTWVPEACSRCRVLRRGLAEIPGVRVVGDEALPCVMRVPLVSFVVEGWDPEELGFALAESFGLVCRTGLHCAPLIHAGLGTAPLGTARFSPSGFTDDADIEAALEAVRRLAG